MAKKPPKPSGPFAELAALRDRLAAEEAEVRAKANAPKPAPGPSAKPKPGAARPSDAARAAAEDDLAFHRLVSGVTPLDRSSPGRRASVAGGTLDAAGRARSVATSREDARATDDEVHEHLRALVDGASRFEVTDDGRRVEGRRDDVPPDWLRKLRRGLLPVDARLDLHGHRADEARDALATFLHDKRQRGERCVLVIHGKGEHSPGGIGVLRGEMAAWLSQGPASTHVAAFATAREEDGGEGALYVLLRRNVTRA
jgi:DNA-nicking Smr family endonuclease